MRPTSVAIPSSISCNPGGLPMGSSKDLETEKAEFRSAWETLKAKHHARAARRGLSGDEHSRRRLTIANGGSAQVSHAPVIEP